MSKLILTYLDHFFFFITNIRSLIINYTILTSFFKFMKAGTVIRKPKFGDLLSNFSFQLKFGHRKLLEHPRNYKDLILN